VKRPLFAALLALVTLSGSWLLSTWFAGLRLTENDGGVVLRHAVLDPYDTPLLQGYGTYRDALIGGDLAAIARLARRDDSYLAYRASLTLARSSELAPDTRLEFYGRAAELRLDDPLAREENREFYLEMGAVAEAAGNRAAALDAYAEALPRPLAVKAVARLANDPYRLSNLYLRARLYSEALEALDGRSAPSIEAPAYQRLEEHQKALAAFEHWLELEPDSLDALYGRAWSHFYLGNMDLAAELFTKLEGSSALYGRALIARRQNRLAEAVDLMRRTGLASRLWQASGWLEAALRDREALAVYLELARGSSIHADDSAYRALVLAQRLGDLESAQAARDLVPEGSFFALRMGSDPLLPDRNGLPSLHLEVQDLAMALARVADLEAAIGELVFALSSAEDEAMVIALAETLQLLGEFRQSQRGAQRYVNAGSREVRTWKVAYPQAYQQLVITEAARQDLEPELLWAVMKQESAFYPKAVSVSNAAGLMQVIPSTWNWLAELQDEAPQDRFDPAANIRYGSYYLRWLMNYHQGDSELVIPSYNRGQGYIRRLFEGPEVNRDKDDFFREIDALETREYLQRVMVNYRTYQALYPSDPLAQQTGANQAAEEN
jgi:soluble lytic murein transglycosylase